MSVSSFQVYRCHSFSGVQDEAPFTPQHIPQNTEFSLILIGPFQQSHPGSAQVWFGWGMEQPGLVKCVLSRSTGPLSPPCYHAAAWNL